MESGGDIQALPEGCIANVVALTSPADACRLCTVSRVFRSAAESDSVWERFLPLDYQSIISRSDATSLSHASSLSSCTSKKQLYFTLCPTLFDKGRKVDPLLRRHVLGIWNLFSTLYFVPPGFNTSFSLVKASGKKCFMLSAKDLVIVWGDTPEYWRWISDPDSRFAQVAELIDVCLLGIRGDINTSMLSPETLYAAYLVFKFTTDCAELANHPVKVSARLVGADNFIQRSVYLNSSTETIHLHPMGPRATTSIRPGDLPKERGDGWQEIELGEFYSKGGEELEMSVLEAQRLFWKTGLVVEGIEIRPKLSAGLT